MHHDNNAKNIALIGFSATGKSTAAKMVAHHLGWDSVDTDEEIVRLTGKTISEIFEQDGEDEFRLLEHKVLKKACLKKRLVISTGGGVILNPKNVKVLFKTCVIVCLEAKVETIYHRLLQDTFGCSSPIVRPLLVGENPLERIRQLKLFRQPYYAVADWTVHTDNLTIEEVSQEVLKGWHYLNRSYQNVEPIQEPDITYVVKTVSRHYPVFVDWGILDKLGEKMKWAGLSGKAVIISDEIVFPIYGNQIKKSMERSGFLVSHHLVPAGESSKSINEAVRAFDFLVNNHIERNDVIVALGGGVVGDLAGFVAATYLRGISLVQVPTTLIGMVDASIGGKVAVDHPQGKNLIGAFYQPNLVLTDVQTLASLPRRELNSGWAEVIKYGLILDAEFFNTIEANAENLTNLAPDITIDAIVHSTCIKGQIVSEDERDMGKRIILNYGHTLAHGIETASKYKSFLHGEAVAIGMAAAAKLSQQLGLLSQSAVQRQQTLLEKFHLPVTCQGINLENVLFAMELDKKVRNKSIHWVLLENIGKAVVRSDIPREDVLTILAEVINT